MSAVENNDHTDEGLTLYILVFAALMFLLVVTIGVAYVDLGLWNIPIALGIASVKALMVIYWFMHVNHGSSRVKLFAGAGFAWVVLMFLFSLADYTTRVPVG